MDQENLNKDWKDNKKTCPFCGASDRMQQFLDWLETESLSWIIKGEETLDEKVQCLGCKKVYYRFYKVTEVKLESVDFYTDVGKEGRWDIGLHWVIDSDGNLKKGNDHPDYEH